MPHIPISAHAQDLLNNKKLYPDIQDLTRCTPTQDRLIGELYLEFQKQLPKFHRLMKAIPSSDGDDLLNESFSRAIATPWKLPHTREELKSLIESYIYTCLKEFKSMHHRKGILSQEYARTQETKTELELTPDMIIDGTSSVMQDALNKAIITAILDDKNKTEIAASLNKNRSTIHRRIERMKPHVTR